MHKLVAMYRMPEDTDAFNEHYFDVHTPLMEAVPGYERIEVSRVTRTLMGEPHFYLMFEMWFADKETLTTALKSDENAAAGTDLMSFAGDLVTVFTTETVDE